MSDVQLVSLAESLSHTWIKLPLAVMRDVGPAVQTFAAFTKLTYTATFVRMSVIAEGVRIPLKTARNHLKTLCVKGWLENRGRGHTPNGAPRRTNTIAMSAKAQVLLGKGRKPTAASASEDGQLGATDLRYGFLPWWASCRYRDRKPLTWAAKALLSIVMARLAALKAASRDLNGKIGAEWLEERLDDRFHFSLKKLQQLTGLSRGSVIAAKRELAQAGIINLSGQGDEALLGDCLAPNPAFRVVITPAGTNRIYVEFKVLADSEMALQAMKAFF